ncbi:MAG: hypothetical protein DMG65_17890 [Candidatus Angelobacter sp. Gp1-AA117]|nr:MAG: hypothetical protein DMG65_17890 [Candidatus Angelobacter sp. Gp1-AA117]
MSSDSHELLMMGITAIVCLPVGYIFGTIIQRWRDVNEFDQQDRLQLERELQMSLRRMERRSA